MKFDSKKLLYFDCEWVPIAPTFESLLSKYPDLAKAFSHQCEKWEAKGEFNSLEESWQEKAHMYPEFCKIITVSYGYFMGTSSPYEFVVRSLYGSDESKILESFNQVLDKVYSSGFNLCGYAIKRFDMPWLSKRMMINGIKPHSSISLYGKKPWEVAVFDLPEAWGQGSMGESYTPFELCCTALGIESSKGELSGSKVKEAFYRGRIEEIKDYCELDVRKSMEVAVKLIELMP